jgi:hypothetical protein
MIGTSDSNEPKFCLHHYFENCNSDGIGNYRLVPDFKRFEATWGKGYVGPRTEEKTMEFFSENNGYDKDSIENISLLRVGETADLSDLSGQHTVKRIA